MGADTRAETIEVPLFNIVYESASEGHRREHFPARSGMYRGSAGLESPMEHPSADDQMNECSIEIIKGAGWGEIQKAHNF